jgi:hypothetical protein
MDPTGASRMGQLVVNCLAIGGGFLAGWFIVAFLATLANRSVRRKGPPSKLQKATRNLGGIAAAILVAIIVFGHGQGWTFFGGGADGSSNGGETKENLAGTTEKPGGEKTTPVSVKISPPVDERIRITILGGDDVKNEAFYIIDEDAKPKTFDEAKVAIVGKRDQLTQKKVGVDIRFSAANALPQDHPAVTRLARWIRNEAALTVSFPAD